MNYDDEIAFDGVYGLCNGRRNDEMLQRVRSNMLLGVRIRWN